MSKFTFICEEEKSPFTEPVVTKRTVEFSAVELGTIIHEFESFLKGCGFQLNGYLEVSPYPTTESITVGNVDLDKFTENLFSDFPNMNNNSTLFSGGAGIDTISITPFYNPNDYK